MPPEEIEESSHQSDRANGGSGVAGPPAWWQGAAPALLGAGMLQQSGPPPIAPPPHKFPLLLQQAVAIFGAAAQLAVTSSQWSRMQAVGRLQTAGLALLSSSVAAFALAFPTVFWTHRILVLSASRIALYSVPSFRSVGVGSALVLERAAQPGWRGALADLGRVGVGTRLLGLAIGGVLIPASPAVTLAVQLTLLRLTMTPDYCSAALLTDGLMQQRTAAAAACLQYATLPILGALPAAKASRHDAGLLHGSAPAGSVCLATVLFLQLAACVIGPTLLSVYSWADPGPPAEPSGPQRWHQRCRFWAQRAEHAASCALCWLLHSPAGGLASHLVVAWWLLAVTWFFCKKLAGLS
ncbi:hypothetical protein ABPG75_012405 [Micractinium tetrahymenae]